MYALQFQPFTIFGWLFFFLIKRHGSRTSLSPSYEPHSETMYAQHCAYYPSRALLSYALTKIMRTLESYWVLRKNQIHACSWRGRSEELETTLRGCNWYLLICNHNCTPAYQIQAKDRVLLCLVSLMTSSRTPVIVLYLIWLGLTVQTTRENWAWLSKQKSASVSRGKRMRWSCEPLHAKWSAFDMVMNKHSCVVDHFEYCCWSSKWWTDDTDAIWYMGWYCWSTKPSSMGDQLVHILLINQWIEQPIGRQLPELSLHWAWDLTCSENDFLWRRGRKVSPWKRTAGSHRWILVSLRSNEMISIHCGWWWGLEWWMFRWGLHYSPGATGQHCTESAWWLKFNSMSMVSYMVINKSMTLRHFTPKFYWNNYLANSAWMEHAFWSSYSLGH